MRRSLAGLGLVALLALAGCGSDAFTLNPYGTFPIYTSSEIGTGSWTILETVLPLQRPPLPIGGFMGALSASGTQVTGAFSTLSTDVYGSGQVSRCLQNPTSPVLVSGTASNGTLTLDGTFETNRLHLTAQLSTDRQSIVSGSYVVTGPCATTVTELSGNFNPPLTGKYLGTSVTSTGLSEHITANLTQSDTYSSAGYIPLTGTLTFNDSTCTVTGPLLDAFVVGQSTEIIAYSTPGVGDNLRLYGFTGQQSTSINLSSWIYYEDPVCGEKYNDPNNPGVLIRQ